MTYDNGGRFYDIGVQDAVSKEWRVIRSLPSVTTILKEASNPALMPWATKITIEGVARLLEDGLLTPGHEADDIKRLLKDAKLRHTDLRDQAGDRGTITHEFLEELAAFGPPEQLPDDPWKAGLIKFWKHHKPKPSIIEIPVACLEGGWAGRIDMLCTMVGRQGNTLVDLKTVKDKSYFTRYPNAYDSNRVQLVVYREALMEENPALDIKNLAVVRVADGDFHVSYVEPGTWQKALDYYKGCLAIWQYRQIEKASA